MKSVLSSAFMVFVAGSLLAEAVVDQELTEPYNMSATINDCCSYVAQTFTAGLDGELVAVNIGVGSDSSFPFHVAIHNVVGGLPGPTVLGEVTLPPGPITFDTPIIFPEGIPIEAGKQYAIMVNYVGARRGETLGEWSGASSYEIDRYPGGVLVYLHEQTWISSGGDGHFRTFVEALPINELVPCAGPRTGGGWTNHGEYVRAVTEATKRYRALGLITEQEAKGIVRAANQSDCGKKDDRETHERHF